MRYSTEHGFFELDPFPSNSSIVVARAVCIFPEHRGQGHGKAQAQTIKEQAQALGYTFMVCTVRTDNEPQLNICGKVTGYVELARFVNPMTDNEVALMGVHL